MLMLNQVSVQIMVMETAIVLQIIRITFNINILDKTRVFNFGSISILVFNHLIYVTSVFEETLLFQSIFISLSWHMIIFIFHIFITILIRPIPSKVINPNILVNLST